MNNQTNLCEGERPSSGTPNDKTMNNTTDNLEVLPAAPLLGNFDLDDGIDWKERFTNHPLFRDMKWTELPNESFIAFGENNSFIQIGQSIKSI